MKVMSGSVDNCRSHLVAWQSKRPAGLIWARVDYLHWWVEGTRLPPLLTASPPGTVQTSAGVLGAVLGLAYEKRRGPWSLEAVARIDLGATGREVTIDGSTRVTVPSAAPVVNTGGLLAQVTNIGVHRTCDFAVMPELELNLGYNITSNIRVLAGYSFLYWTQVAGPPRPAFQDNTTDL
ncbi:MAG: BBP7 family outer membrane beta-barrel protein [Gemmataceae bacterium]|nr:BBP7 family outer membrane beta-barrel protein [Gemmataceae bacterium]